MFIVLSQEIAEVCWELRNEFGVLCSDIKPIWKFQLTQMIYLKLHIFYDNFLYSMYFSYVDVSDEHLFQRVHII